VYTVSKPAAAEKELRSLDGNGEVWGREIWREEGDKKCLEEAVSKVEQGRMEEALWFC